MDRCDSCRYQNDFEFHACHICHMERDMYRPKETNADRIRAMSDEKLAAFICGLLIDRNIEVTSEAWLDWLRQEADHGHPD